MARRGGATQLKPALAVVVGQQVRKRTGVSEVAIALIGPIPARNTLGAGCGRGKDPVRLQHGSASRGTIWVLLWAGTAEMEAAFSIIVDDGSFIWRQRLISQLMMVGWVFH